MLGSNRGSSQFSDAVSPKQAPVPAQRQQAAASPPRHSTSGPGGSTFRVVYSSEDSLSDGELHVERRTGSISAWYQRGAAPGGSPRRAAQAGAASEHSGSEAGSDHEDHSQPLRSSVTVVLHDDEAAGVGKAAGEGGATVSKAELSDMITWETNNLFDYLKGLCHPGSGTDEAQQQGPVQLDGEEWTRRTAALRQLLRERDGEVQQLQRLLDDRLEQLEEQQGEVAQQAQRIRELEERIRQLLRQLEAAHQESGSSSPVAVTAFHHHPVEVQKRRLAAAYQPASDSYFMQLPAQSFAEHQGCGLWQSVTEFVQQRPRLWGGCLAALVLLLLIILCATLIPAARRRHQRPRFLAPIGVAATGASWIDLAVQLDRPGVVSYMAFRQADLNQQVPGLGHTLLELIQMQRLKGRAVYAASAAGSSLDPGNAPQAGLQQLAVACSWAPMATASSSTEAPATSVTMLSAAGPASAACSAASSASPGRCSRCPQLEDGTAYTILVVAASPSGSAVSGVEVVNAMTGAAAVNVDPLQPPFVDNVTATSFNLHYKLNSPGTLYYAVAHDTLAASYGAFQLSFGSLTPTSSAVMGANPAAFIGGLVANGSVAVAAGGEWASTGVQPGCVAALCQYSLYGLQGGTAYKVFLVAVDSYGVADPAPAVASFTTPPATSAPQLLDPTGPGNVTASSFDVAVSTDAAGGVYFMLLAAKPDAGLDAADVEPGSWRQLESKPSSGSRRRHLLSAVAGGDSEAASPGNSFQRQLSEAQPAGAPGTLVEPTCYPTNRTCSASTAALFSSAIEKLGGGGMLSTVASGCLPVPAAGQTVQLPPFAGLANNTLHYLLLSTEDMAVPRANRLQPPAAYAIRTVDLSAPQLACGFPVATNITSSSFSLAAMLTKPGASVFYVVMPSSAVSGAGPSASDIMRGSAAGGAPVVAAGSLSRASSLPWEVAPAAGAGDARKLWAPVAGLQSGVSYTAYLTISADGNQPVPGGPVAVLSGILTPNIVAPTFNRLRGLNASVDEQRGTFSVQLSTALDRAGQVYYALYRNYSCTQGDPSVADIVAGNALPASVCKCEDTSYCAVVNAGSFAVPAQGLGGAVHAVGGDLSPLPFQSLRGATDEQLKCFQGGLGQATDTYNIYLVAGNALPSNTGLAPQCSNFGQAAAVAAAAAAGVGSPDSSCPAAPQIACAQNQLRPDSQTLQSGGFLQWPVNSSAAAASNSSSPVVWQQPAGDSVAGRPAKVQLSLEGGAAPAFTYGPVQPAGLRTSSGFGMQFALDKPALLIYAVFRPMPIDASGKPQAPVLIATGRVPVFDAAVNVSTGVITACPWAPGGPMQPQSQYYVTYVARDKYGRMDGLCPGQQQGAAPRVCSDMALTGG